MKFAKQKQTALIGGNFYPNDHEKSGITPANESHCGNDAIVATTTL